MAGVKRAPKQTDYRPTGKTVFPSEGKMAPPRATDPDGPRTGPGWRTKSRRSQSSGDSETQDGASLAKQKIAKGKTKAQMKRDPVFQGLSASEKRRALRNFDGATNDLSKRMGG